jgi:hypothetical protein
MKETVYLETTVVSYYTSRPSNDIIVLSRQRLTEQWWTDAFKRFDIFISEAVIEEATAGDPIASQKRLEALSTCSLLDIDDEVSKIYNVYLDRLEIPEKAFRDALHLAVATVHKMDFLVTWNCAHIANGETIKRLIAVNSELGLSIPVIVTPEELMKE